jgi:hypothetical protein
MLRSLTAAADGKTLSYMARASRMSRILSSSDFGTNLTTSPIFRSKPDVGMISFVL